MADGQTTEQDLARPVLDPLSVDRGVKHAAWDAFHKSQSPEEFRAYFDSAPLPQESKRALWDAKFGGTTPAGAGSLQSEAAKPQAQAPTGKDWLKSFFWLPKLSRTLGQTADWAEAKRNEAEVQDLGKKEQRPQGRYEIPPAAGYDVLHRMLRTASGATNPVNVGIAGATVLAPEIMGPALATHGVAGMLKHGGAAKDLVTKGEANPDEMEAFLGSGAEIAGGAAITGGAVAGGLKNTATGKLMRAANRTIIKGEPPQVLVPEAQKALTQAVQPGVNIPRAQESIQIAGPRLQQLRQSGAIRDLDGNPISEIKNTGQMLGAVRAAKQHVLGAIEDRLGPVAELQVDTSGIASEMRASISKRVRTQFPQQAARIEARAATYEQPQSLRDLENAIIDANDDLKGFYKQPVAGDSPVSADIKATLGEVRAARKLLDEKVETLSGEGVKDLKREYGALRDIERATARQHAVATRTKEGTLWEGLSYLHAAGDLVSGNALGAARAGAAITVGRMLKTLRNPDFLIEQSFHGPKAFQAAEPIAPHTGPPAPKGLLPAPATELGYTQEEPPPSREGRWVTPKAFLPEPAPIEAKFLREILKKQSAQQPPVKGLLPSGEAQPTNIPPIPEDQFTREEIGTPDEKILARGGGVRQPVRGALPQNIAEQISPQVIRRLLAAIKRLEKKFD